MDAVAGVSSLGITLSYGVETTAGEKPATFTILHRINDIGEISIDPEKIDASALEDSTTKYISGRSDVSDTWTVTVNETNDTITEWETLISAHSALTGGKKMWFQVINPDITKAQFVKAAPPAKLPLSAKAQNELSTMAINLTLEDYIGYDTKVTPS